MKAGILMAVLAACVGCGAPRVAPPAPSVAQSPAPAAPASGAGASSAASSAPAEASPPAPSPPSRFDVAAIDEYIAHQMTARGFVGLSVSIVMDGKLVLEKGYGQSQLGPDAPVQAGTPFMVASITKQLVASLILLLAEEKKLSVDDKVARYFPDLTRAGDITLLDLMNHVSGYRDSSPLPFPDRETTQPATPDEIISRYARRPLDFEPRTRFSYSNTGYKILGRIIEKVTGKPLGTVLAERIFRPLGMTHSFYMPAPGTPGLARGYTTFALGPVEPATPDGQGWAFGSSGLYTSAGDLARWSLALMSGKVLGPSAYKLFTTPRRLADGRMTTYACGIQTGTNKGGDEILQHSGRDPGFAGWSYLLPRTRSSVVILSNRDDARPWDLMTEIVTLINKEHRPPPIQVAGPPADAVARDILTQMQSGEVDRRRFGDEYNAFLTDARLRAASPRLRALGAPTHVALQASQERGGMEEASVRFTFGTTRLDVAITRSVDGKVQAFAIDRP